MLRRDDNHSSSSSSSDHWDQGNRAMPRVRQGQEPAASRELVSPLEMMRPWPMDRARRVLLPEPPPTTVPAAVDDGDDRPRRRERDDASLLRQLFAAKAAKASASAASVKHMTNSEKGKFYRAKKKAHAQQLQADVRALWHEICALQTRRDALRDALVVSHRHTAFGPCVQLARAYCALFQYGLAEDPEIPGRHQRRTRRPSSSYVLPRPTAPDQREQIAFVHATMTEDMALGSLRGRDKILEQWRRYSVYHARLRFDVVAVDALGSAECPVVVAQTAMRVRFSRATLEAIFPHVLADEWLVQQLVGVEVVYPVTCTLYFDAAGQIERFDPVVDFAPALVAALQDAEAAHVVLQHARIQSQHALLAEDGVDEEEQEDQDDNQDDVLAAVTAAGEQDGEQEEPGGEQEEEDSEGRDGVVIPSRMGLGYLLS